MNRYTRRIQFVFLILLSGKVFAAPAVVFSLLEDGRDVRIRSIRVGGLKRIPETVFRRRDLRLQPGQEVKVQEIRAAVKRIRECGFFSSVRLRTTGIKEALVLNFEVREQPILRSIKFGGDYFVNLKELQTLFQRKGIVVGKIFNEYRIREALQQYREALQVQGYFLFYIKYRVGADLDFTEKWSRAASQKPVRIPDRPLNLMIHLFKINFLLVDSIRVEGNNRISDHTIIRQLEVQPGTMIQNNRSLLLSLWNLNRLGIFSYLYFDIRPLTSLQRAELVVRVKEIESDIVNTSVSLNSRNEFNLELDYFNYSIGDNLARLSTGVVFDFKKESINFVGLFSFPKLFQDYFFNARVERDGLYTPIQADWEKLTETISLDFTLGRRLARYWSVYSSLRYVFTENTLVKGSGSPPAGYFEEGYHSSVGKIFLMLDSLDDNFYPTLGIRSILAVEFPLFSELDEYLLLDHKLEFYFPLYLNVTFAFYGHTVWLIGDDERYSIQLEKRRRTTAQDRLAEALTRIGMTAYACLEFRWRFLDQFAIFFFGETAGAWSRILDFEMRDLHFGIGLGLRIAPRQHYYAHIFKYPWSFSFGYNISSRQKDDISYSIVSSRDEYYYINLQASF